MSSRRQHVGVATAAVLAVGFLAGCGTRTELTSAEPESTAPVTVFVFTDDDHAPLDVAQLVAHPTTAAGQAPTAQETVDLAAQVRRAVAALLDHAPAEGEPVEARLLEARGDPPHERLDDGVLVARGEVGPPPRGLLR